VLIKDQADALTELGLDAGVLNSLQSEHAAEQIMAGAQLGETKAAARHARAPGAAEFLALASSVCVSLLVVDEAHSISEWEHSFRPAYLGLASAHDRFDGPRSWR
jgi:ATP-dependent DNA helicase RecQ